MNLADNLVATASRHGSRHALRLRDQVVSYAELEHRSRRVAGLLRAKGVGAGDRVGLMVPNVPAFAECYYGILRAGAVVVPMNVLLKEREVAYYLTDSGAQVLLAWHELEEAAAGSAQGGAELVAVTPDLSDAQPEPLDHGDSVVGRAASDTAVILYTSGTTGTPKGAELSHGNLGTNVEVCVSLFDLTETDVVFGALPLFHSFGQTCGLNTCVRVGACLTLLPRFDPAQALALFGRHRVTVFQGVPTMYSALLDHPAAGHDTGSLRRCVSGGAALPLEVIRGFEQAFGCVILEGYGLSETSPVASFNPAGRRKPGSVGIPVPGVEMAVVDRTGMPLPPGEVGEIFIRGHNVMKGYWNRPEATAEAMAGGWFHTGDLATIDEDGYVFIVDRLKDMIIRGGYNVYPREIEEVLYEHPAVAEAAVVGVADVRLGEEVAAAVTLRPGTPAVPEELIAFVRERVAAYKYPRHVCIVDSLPKGPSGKILKREITIPVAGTEAVAR